jgi:hypothetical protein
MHDMAIGKDQAVGSEDETGASATAFAGLAGARAGCGVMHLNVHERRADAVDCAGNGARVGIEKFIIRGYIGFR